ncbi:MAG: DNA repair protein RadA [Oscillospiraceae bacterium]|nr:DNA repair protein RadA [Oscillospiraceae bacterium]
MAMKSKTVYVCTQCGCQLPKWQGRCPDCGEWNSIVQEELQVSPASANRRSAAVTMEAQPLSAITADEGQRLKTGIAEFDRVLGGGIVPGSVVLLCGDPGIGKSTILLQVCHHLSQQNKVLYVSGEESLRQIKLRANRLNINGDDLLLSAATDAASIVESIKALQPDLVVIDSIQTMNLQEISSSPGSVTQVRECTQQFIAAAKGAGVPIFLVGHVNKDGGIAGPKVLEHMVDTVLYFEGDRNLSYRILRAIKNRYGSTNEIGVFEMEAVGLAEVENPSKMLLEGRPEGVSGTCVVSLMEGTRPILAEVQALVAKSALNAPRRVTTGFDFNRTNLLIAVLEKRAGFRFGTLDAYVNVAGGLHIDEPAADLAVALALISNLVDKPLPADAVAFGELGLTGEIRGVSQPQQRVSEAYRLGLRTFILPSQCLNAVKESDFPDAKFYAVRNLSQALRLFRGASGGEE